MLAGLADGGRFGRITLAALVALDVLLLALLLVTPWARQ